MYQGSSLSLSESLKKVNTQKMSDSFCSKDFAIINVLFQATCILNVKVTFSLLHNITYQCRISNITKCTLCVVMKSAKIWTKVSSMNMGRGGVTTAKECFLVYYQCKSNTKTNKKKVAYLVIFGKPGSVLARVSTVQCTCWWVRSTLPVKPDLPKHLDFLQLWGRSLSWRMTSADLLVQFTSE